MGIEEAELRYLRASFARLRLRLAALQSEALSSLAASDYEAFGRCLRLERKLLAEQKRLIKRFAVVTGRL